MLSPAAVSSESRTIEWSVCRARAWSVLAPSRVASGSEGAARTSTLVVSSAVRPPSSVIRSRNVSVSSASRSAGAVKVAVADDADDSVTVVPAVWLHA